MRKNIVHVAAALSPSKTLFSSSLRGLFSKKFNKAAFITQHNKMLCYCWTRLFGYVFIFVWLFTFGFPWFFTHFLVMRCAMMASVFGIFSRWWVDYTTFVDQTYSFYVLWSVLPLNILFSTSLSMVLFNACSVTNHFCWTALYNPNNPDFLFLTETWQQSADHTSLIELCLRLYSFIGQPWLLGHGGGLAAAFSNQFSYFRLTLDDFHRLSCG